MEKKYIPFTNDFMFCSVLEDERYCKEFLERILGIKIASIEVVSKQKSIENVKDYKSVRLDIYVTDIEGNSYDIEMQTTCERYLPLRVRYYHSEMDGYVIKKGSSYKELGQNVVIFICSYDPFGYGESVYTFKNTCQQHGDLLLDDKIDTVIININGWRENIREDLRILLDFIKTGQAGDEYTALLKKKVDVLNADDEWRNSGMTVGHKMEEMKEAGIEIGMQLGMQEGMQRGIQRGMQQGMQEGMQKTRISLIKKMMKKNMSLQDIIEMLELPEEEVMPIYNAICKLGVDATDDEIYSSVYGNE